MKEIKLVIIHSELVQYFKYTHILLLAESDTKSQLELVWFCSLLSFFELETYNK